MFDSAMNITAYLGNTTENFFKISNLKLGHNYSFTVQARCLYSGQMCGEPATLLYDELQTGKALACFFPLLFFKPSSKKLSFSNGAQANLFPGSSGGGGIQPNIISLMKSVFASYQ